MAAHMKHEAALAAELQTAVAESNPDSQVVEVAFFVICACLVHVCHTNLMGDTMLSSFLIRFNSDELTC